MLKYGYQFAGGNKGVIRAKSFKNTFCKWPEMFNLHVSKKCFLEKDLYLKVIYRFSQAKKRSSTVIYLDVVKVATRGHHLWCCTCKCYVLNAVFEVVFTPSLCKLMTCNKQ